MEPSRECTDAPSASATGASGCSKCRCEGDRPKPTDSRLPGVKLLRAPAPRPPGEGEDSAPPPPPPPGEPAAGSRPSARTASVGMLSVSTGEGRHHDGPARASFTASSSLSRSSRSSAVPTRERRRQDDARRMGPCGSGVAKSSEIFMDAAVSDARRCSCCPEPPAPPPPTEAPPRLMRLSWRTSVRPGPPPKLMRLPCRERVRGSEGDGEVGEPGGEPGEGGAGAEAPPGAGGGDGGCSPAGDAC